MNGLMTGCPIEPMTVSGASSAASSSSAMMSDTRHAWVSIWTFPGSSVKSKTSSIDRHSFLPACPNLLVSACFLLAFRELTDSQKMDVCDSHRMADPHYVPVAVGGRGIP